MLYLCTWYIVHACVMVQNRNINIDLAKALAMVLVVLQHAWTMLDLDNPELGLMCGAYRAIATVGVPLFVFVSGALLLPRPIASLRLFYKKRMLRLLLPFVVLALVVYLMTLCTGGYTWWDGTIKNAIISFVPALLNNQINTFHWFVHMLLALYLLTPFMQYALQRLSQREIEGGLLVWSVVMLLKQYYPSLAILQYVGSLWTYMGVYIAGYYIIQYRVGERMYLWIATIATLLLYVWDMLTDCATQLGLPLTAIVLGMLLLNVPMKTVSDVSFVGQVIRNTSRYSYTIYLLHIPFIRMLYQVLPNVISMNEQVTAWMPLWIMPIVMVTFYIGCLCYDKIKYLPNQLIGIG